MAENSALSETPDREAHEQCESVLCKTRLATGIPRFFPHLIFTKQYLFNHSRAADADVSSRCAHGLISQMGLGARAPAPA